MPTILKPEDAQKAYELLTAWVAANHPDVVEIPDRRIDSNEFPGLNLRGLLNKAGINFDPFHDHEIIGASFENPNGFGVNTITPTQRTETVDIAKLRQYLPQKQPVMALTLES